MELYTAQIARWRDVAALEVRLIDITAKSGIKAFAPSFERVMEYKRGELSESAYTELYHKRMSESLWRFPQRWEELTSYKEPVALACYCRAGAFCHRHLLKDILEQYCKDLSITFNYKGEITKEGIVILPSHHVE